LKRTLELKTKVAREAAILLYFGAEKEYKQAKVKAAETLRTSFLPTNFEVALELNHIAEENEGADRKQRLIQMREEALKIMNALAEYEPLLIGSVWRGAIRRGSDIDIAVYHDLPEQVLNILVGFGCKISGTEWATVTNRGKTWSSFHIYTETQGKHKVEITVRSPEEASRKRKCEIFGDEIRGLNVHELTELLRENPSRQFIPA
jgi:predicted nucleotidyltransferase